MVIPGEFKQLVDDIQIVWRKQQIIFKKKAAVCSKGFEHVPFGAFIVPGYAEIFRRWMHFAVGKEPAEQFHTRVYVPLVRLVALAEAIPRAVLKQDYTILAARLCRETL